MRYVIDTSVAFKWVVPEPDSDKALQLRDDYTAAIHELFSPDLFASEIANSLVVAERRGRIPRSAAQGLFLDVLRTVPAIHGALPDLAPRACAIALATVASVYDSLYVALAEREGCEFVTADGRLVTNLQGKFPFIRPLSSFPSPLASPPASPMP
jgi:predicted nucleic acid-binding protein